MKKVFIKSPLLIVSIGIFALFAFYPFAVLVTSSWPHLYGFVNVPFIQWEELICYFPFANTFSPDLLVSIAPTYDESITGMSIYPFITFSITGLIYKYISLGNIDTYFLVMHALFPVIVFGMLYKIYNLYIPKVWALCLAFLSIGYYASNSSLDQLFSIITSGHLFTTSSIIIPEVTRTPFPSVSLPLFLIPFYYTLKTHKLSDRRFLVLTLLWALQIYVYIYNFIAGVAFFLPWIIYARFFSGRKFNLKAILLQLSLAMLVIFIICSPYFLELSSPLAQQFLSKITPDFSGRFALGEWGGISYLLPIVVLALLIYIFRCDAYEFFFKFTPVLIIVFVDFFIGVLHLILPSAIAPELYYSRLSSIAFRFFYFIPVIYFSMISPKHPAHGMSKKLVLIRTKLHSILRHIFFKHSKKIAVSGCLIIYCLIGLNELNRLSHHHKFVATSMSKIESKLKIVSIDSFSEKVDNNTTFLYENLPANILSTIKNRGHFLLNSSFGNYISEELVLDRLILYAKSLEWSIEQFLEFMRAPRDIESDKSQVIRGALVDENYFKSGLGYWLYMHQKKKSLKEEAEYVTFLQKKYRDETVETLTRKLHLKIVYIDAISSIDSTVH